MKKLLMGVLVAVGLFGAFAGIAGAQASPKLLIHLDDGAGW
jgi:hypothetical protein